MTSSSTVLLADYPKLPLAEDRTKELASEAKDWAHAHGLVYRTSDHKDASDICQIAPLALLPTPFPKQLFQQACNVQDSMATLYHELAYDFDFLIDCHEAVVKTDPFTRGLIDILKQVREQGLAQPLTLAIQRSDYMVHKDPFSCEYVLRQIEVNNIASSMGAHAERATKLHRRTLAALGYDKQVIDTLPEFTDPATRVTEYGHRLLATKTNQRDIHEMQDEVVMKTLNPISFLMNYNPIAVLNRVLLESHFKDESAVMLVVIEDANQNQIDQRHVEYALEALGIPVDQIVRKTLGECHECLTLTKEKQLMMSDSRVAVVYFRAGYSPEHYPTEKEWKARLTMELSDAIKAPWIGLQVANTKKTQQVLSADGTIERYVGQPREANRLRATFAGMWPLEGTDEVTEKIIKSAISHPSRFVLKPQTEGGGGNYYGDEIAEKLKTMSLDERAAHILMERIEPLKMQNYLVRAFGDLELTEVVSELGVYGYAFGIRGKAEAKTGGHLLRTKGHKTNEGGVAVGAAVIDSPFLFDPL